MARQYVVFRILSPVETPRGWTKESVCPAVNEDGREICAEDERACVAIVDRLNRENRRIGSDYCANLTYTVGWRDQ
jgi:hypothetical protein